MDQAIQAVDEFEIEAEPAREPFKVDDDAKAECIWQQ